jgi:hypothetical protein
VTEVKEERAGGEGVGSMSASRNPQAPGAGVVSAKGGETPCGPCAAGHRPIYAYRYNECITADLTSNDVHNCCVGEQHETPCPLPPTAYSA